MRKIHTCKNPLCQNQTPAKDMFCSYECFMADRDRTWQTGNGVQPAPMPTVTSRSAYPRIHSRENRS